MTTQLFLELSTRLVQDLKAWSEEATRRDSMSPDELAVLHHAAAIVDRVTVAAVALPPE